MSVCVCALFRWCLLGGRDIVWPETPDITNIQRNDRKMRHSSAPTVSSAIPAPHRRHSKQTKQFSSLFFPWQLAPLCPRRSTFLVMLWLFIYVTVIGSCLIFSRSWLFPLSSVSVSCQLSVKLRSSIPHPAMLQSHTRTTLFKLARCGFIDAAPFNVPSPVCVVRYARI